MKNSNVLSFLGVFFPAFWLKQFDKCSVCLGTTVLKPNRNLSEKTKGLPEIFYLPIAPMAEASPSTSLTLGLIQAPFKPGYPLSHSSLAGLGSQHEKQQPSLMVHTAAV